MPFLYNVTGQSARVRKVSLVALTPASACSVRQCTPNQPVGIVDLNLNRLCRKSYLPSS